MRFLAIFLGLCAMLSGPQAFAERPFFVGYNEGWFGPNFGLDLTLKFDETQADKTLESLQRAGGSVVRLWLFEAGQGLLLNKYAPQVRGVDAGMLKNLEKIILSAKKHHLKIYLTLLDGNTMKGLDQAQRDFFWNLMNNKFGEQDAFLAKGVAPVLKLLDAHRDDIFGLDLINEIQGARVGLTFHNVLSGPRDWIRRSAEFVKRASPWLKITASAGGLFAASQISLGAFSGLGLDFYDLHAYSDSGSISGVAGVCARAKEDGVPVILGEFGQESHTYDDQLQKKVTANFLAAAKKACFAGALAWRLDASENWWSYLRPDGSFRPAVSVIQGFGK